MSDVTMSEVLQHHAALSQYMRIPFGDVDGYKALSNKTVLFRQAQKLNIPMPATIFSEDYPDDNELRNKCAQLPYPIVFKPCQSRIFTGNRWISAKVEYLDSDEALEAFIGQKFFRTFPYLIQEKIDGYGFGVFLLCYNGRIMAQFAHRRIREKPPSGGVSVMCESMAVPPNALNWSEKLIEWAQWNGVAMVEFKHDRKDNLPKLMEVNARFWGSLQLAITSGVDFPHLLLKCSDGDSGFLGNYKIGCRSRWELGDLDHLLIRLRKPQLSKYLPPSSKPIPNLMRDFVMDFSRPKVHHEVFRIDDPKPFLWEVQNYLRNFIAH